MPAHKQNFDGDETASSKILMTQWANQELLHNIPKTLAAVERSLKLMASLVSRLLYVYLTQPYAVYDMFCEKMPCIIPF